MNLNTVMSLRIDQAKTADSSGGMTVTEIKNYRNSVQETRKTSFSNRLHRTENRGGSVEIQGNMGIREESTSNLTHKIIEQSHYSEARRFKEHK
jgi:hypothetical protein